MKTLRKGNDFKRLADSSLKDLKEINSYIKSGWKYSPKKDYKDTYKKVEKTSTDEPAENKKEKKTKSKK